MTASRALLVLVGLVACAPQHPRLVVGPTVDAAADAVVDEPLPMDAGFDSDVVTPIDRPTATDLGVDEGMDAGSTDAGVMDADAGSTDAGPRDADAADVPALVDTDVVDVPPSGTCGADRERCCMGSMPCRTGLTCVSVGVAFCTPCGGSFQTCCDGGCSSGPCRGGFCTGF